MRSFIQLWCLCALVLWQGNAAIAQNNGNKKVILEHLTGAWCGLCPEGMVTMRQLSSNFPDLIPVAMHVDDVMTIPSGANLGELYTGSGVNAFLLDRYLFPDEQFVPFTFQYDPLAEKVAERLAEPSPVALRWHSISLDTLSRTLSASMSAHFDQAVASYNDLRFNLWLLEDSVMQAGSTYAQVNYFDVAPGYFYTGAGNPMYDFPHRHVLRASLGNEYGTPASLPTPAAIAPQDSFVVTYTYSLPEHWNLAQLSLVGLVQNYDSTDYHHNQILNAQQISLREALAPYVLPTDTTIVTTDTTQVDTTATGWQPTMGNTVCIAAQAYPNPANQQLHLSAQLPTYINTAVCWYLYDATGNCVASLPQAATNNQQYHLTYDTQALSNGIYVVGIKAQNQQWYGRVVIQH